MNWKLIKFSTLEAASPLASDLRATLFQAYKSRPPLTSPVLYRNGPATGTAIFYVAPEAVALVADYLSMLNAIDCEEPDLGTLIPLLLSAQP